MSVFVGKHEGKRLLRRPRGRWKDDVRIYVRARMIRWEMDA
jgi:hypothetical protein